VRNTTTTPTQALALWNNELVLEMSERVATRLSSEFPKGDSIALATAAWRVVLQRSPDPIELSMAERLVEEHGLEALARVLFNSNEFLLVD
jgi:hypothetical protein